MIKLTPLTGMTFSAYTTVIHNPPLKRSKLSIASIILAIICGFIWGHREGKDTAYREAIQKACLIGRFSYKGVVVTCTHVDNFNDLQPPTRPAPPMPEVKPAKDIE